ncbi:MAG: hypothetical protein N3F11_03185 [Casimicrobiaceae bacterium]|nr:hypothetical protein [Casimicrobiaceae bacterium]
MPFSPNAADEAQALRTAVEKVDRGDFATVRKLLDHAGWNALETLFWNASHPLRASASRAFHEYIDLAQLLWTRLGAGTREPLCAYRQALDSPPMVDAMLRILARLYAGCNLAYSPPPQGFWRTVYAITGYLLSRSRDNPDVFARELNYCMQLWLMAWLNPLSLVAGRLPVAVQLIGVLSKSCTFSLAPPTHAGSGLAAADLADDRGPIPFPRLPDDWSPELPLYVNAQSAAYAIEALHASAAASTKGDVYETLLGTGRSVGLSSSEVRDFVKRALREFGQSRARSKPRVPATGALSTVVGFIELWTALDEHSHASDVQKAKSQAGLRAELVNRTDGGFLLRYRISEPRLRAGTLMGMRATEAEPWILAVIRWLQDNGSDVLVGVEVLNNYPRRDLATPDDRPTQAPIIYFENDDGRQIFLPLGHADPGSVCQMNVGDEIWVTSVVQELGDDWEMRLLLDTLPRR